MSQQLFGIDPKRTVHKSVYTKATYEMEKEKIFRKIWHFVAHESEFPEAGSYITRVIADDPLVFVKGEDDNIRGFYNTCRHRGSLVCTEDQGQCNKAMVCPYHNWSFSFEGTLLGVPGIDAYEGTGFRKEDFGLVPVRTENKHGMIFTCLDELGPNLEEYMGEPLVELLRNTVGQAKFEMFHKKTFTMKANWKLLAENAVDGYHVPFVHEFLRKGSPPKEWRMLGNGHAVQDVVWAKQAVNDEIWEISQKYPLPGLESLQGHVIIIYPDLIIQPRGNTFQIMNQIAVDEKTSVLEERAFGIVGDTPEERDVRVRCWEVWAAQQPAEDIQVLEWQQRGVLSNGMPVSLIARGEDMKIGIRGDDSRLREFWNVWRKYMGVEQNAGVE